MSGAATRYQDERASGVATRRPLPFHPSNGLMLRQLDVAVDDPDERFRARDAAELDAEVRQLVPVVPPICQHLQAIDRNRVSQCAPVELKMIDLRAGKVDWRAGQLDSVIPRVATVGLGRSEERRVG